MFSFGPKQFLAISLGVLFLLMGLYYARFKYQLGSPVQAEWWVKNIYQYKDYVADKVKSPKIIIIAGSNALFGINSKIIEDATGYEVVNLAAHAELTIDFLYQKIKDNMGEGDIIVMPLEGNYYIRNKVSESFVNNMLAWGWEDYLSKLNIYDLLKFIVSVPKKRIHEGIVKQNGTNPVLPKDEVVKKTNTLLSTKVQKFRGYSYKNLNKYGDFNSGEKPTESLLKLSDKGLYYMHDGKICDRFGSAYKKIMRIINKNNGRLIITWPVTIRNKVFDLSNSKYQRKVDKRREQLAEKSIIIQCNPALFNLDVKFFFDTKSHLNKYGTEIRSENLAQCLSRILENDGHPDLSYDEALKKVKKQELNMSEKM